METWISEVFTSDFGWNHLEDLVDVGDRMAGTSGERKGAELTRDRLEEAGVRNVSFDEFEIQGWERGISRISAGGEKFGDHNCIALPRSPSGSEEGELVDLGYGLPRDFEDNDLEGKIVMAASNVPSHYDRYIHRREKYYYAVREGAAGFVYKNHVEGCLPPTGSVGTDEDPIGEIPAVGVSKELGSALSRRYEGEEVEIGVEAEIYEGESQNIHGELGPETEKEVLVTSHVDAHDISEGAMDNGSGTAMVVELAKALAEREDELDTRVRFVVFGAEEVGLVGSEYESERMGKERENIKAIINNDGVVRGRTLSFHTHDFETLEEAANDVGEEFGHPVKTVPEQMPHSDHWPFVKWGVPGYHVMSVTDDEGRGWGHTYADTLDKLDKRDLREQAILLTELSIELASDERETVHKDEEEIAQALEEEDVAEGMKIIGDWPYDFGE